MIQCRECGKELKNTQALSGHMRLKHGERKMTSAGVLSKPPPKSVKVDLVEEFELLKRSDWRLVLVDRLPEDAQHWCREHYPERCNIALVVGDEIVAMGTLS